MQPQVVHEAEVHRQHVRLKIPIQVEIDGVRYQVDDWSMGGFGVESVMTSRQAGEKFSARLFFPFEDFDMSMRFDARMIYADQEHGRFGCAFVSISQDQSALFRYLIDAYLSGEVVSAGDILQVRGRENTAMIVVSFVWCRIRFLKTVHNLIADEFKSR
jgi:alginate biosynthesis protein Alg44